MTSAPSPRDGARRPRRDRGSAAYPEESAGRLMQRDLIAVPEHWTVGQVIDYLRAADDLTDRFLGSVRRRPAHHPVGTCMLSTGSCVRRAARAVSDRDEREQTLIPVDMDQEEVALRSRNMR